MSWGFAAGSVAWRAARLDAYLTAANSGHAIPSVADLRDHLRHRVPDFMIPATFTELAVLPLTPAGKIDRVALPGPSQGDTQPNSDYVVPETRTEELLAGIWSHVLGRTRVGTSDNFFELGGHSLLATKVVSRIGEVFGIELPLINIFHEPTIAETALTIDRAALGNGGAPDPGSREEFEF